PGLRSFVISPSYNPMPPVIVTPDNEDSVRMFVPEPTEEEEAAFQRLVDSIKVRGVTIGPTAPPANFVPLAFLDTLISYKHQAFALGWIINKGIITSLDQKLENAKKQLQNKDNKSAKNILQAFVNDIEALNKQSNQITSEAFALLKFNAEFLISKL
ncbi:MAG: FIMAH domain-containing protein, partial [Bacteroidota bacterium]